MSAHSCSVRRRCTATLLLITLPGLACQAWHTERVAPQVVLATQPTKLRVTRTDGGQIVLQHPVVRADTLVGIDHHQQDQQEVHIALTDVRQVATRRFSAGRTVGLGVGVAAFVGGGILVAYAIACGNNACSN